MESANRKHTRALTHIIRALLSPQVLIMLISCLFLLFWLVRSVTPPLNAPNLDFSQTEPVDIQIESLELLIYDTNQLEVPKIQDVEVGVSQAERTEALLNALKEALAIWPTGLRLGAVYVTDINSIETTVIDWIIEGNLALSLNDEWRLLNSIATTLERNQIKPTKMLINHKPSKVFLRYIALDAFNN